MTALAAWEAPAATINPARPERAVLRLVPPLSAHSPVRVRVTRRGRIVRAGMVLVFVIVVAGLLVGAVRSAGSANALSATATGSAAVAAGAAAADVVPRVVTVTAGQTLSEIALAELPDLPIREGVARIQLANNLNTDQVRAGQRLRIPAP